MASLWPPSGEEQPSSPVDPVYSAYRRSSSMQKTKANILLAKDYKHPDPISDEEFERGKAPWFFMSLEGTMVRCSELFPISSPPCCFCHQDPTGWWISEKLDGVRAVWRNGEFCSRGDNTFVARRAHCDPIGFIVRERETERDREREGGRTGHTRPYP